MIVDGLHGKNPTHDGLHLVSAHAPYLMACSQTNAVSGKPTDVAVRPPA